jgi:cation transport regulator ChaC
VGGVLPDETRVNDVWIFGYGSLLFRPGFDFVERVTAWAHGWERRFFQGSPDHRGVPESLGRVVTLVPRADAKVGGVAFRLAAAEAARTFDVLDFRERGGYSRLDLDLVDARDAPLVRATTYIATPDNPHWLGDAPDEALARHIARSAGPSGANRDYLLQLDHALRELGIDDAHVARLATLVASG